MMLKREIPIGVAFSVAAVVFALLAFFEWRAYGTGIKTAAAPSGQGAMTYKQYCTSCHTNARTMRAMRDKAGGDLPWDHSHGAHQDSKGAASAKSW